MLYYLADILEKMDFPGARLMDYITFRSGAALVLSLFIALVIGRKIINRLQLMQVGEIIRDLDIEGQQQKKGTPTMGGVIIIISIVIPCLLVGNLSNVYMILLLVSTIWLGSIGFLDDYLKIKRQNKDGLKGKFKIVGQVGLGVIVGTVMCLSEQVVVVDKNSAEKHIEVVEVAQADGSVEYKTNEYYVGEKSTKTTIPFVKNNEFDYHWFVPSHTSTGDALTWVLYVLVAIFVITAVSNGSNLTDGLDGLNTGVSAIVAVVLSVLAYLSGHVIYADYLNIMYIPGAGELAVFGAAFVGALIGFLWYNCFPAQVFMGDTGSLAIGGIIAVFALAIRKELLLPILCGIYLVEVISVMIQTGYFKYTKKRYGQGRRILKMAPMHHHYQKMGFHENKIVIRFWIVQILLAAFSLATLKIR